MSETILDGEIGQIPSDEKQYPFGIYSLETGEFRMCGIGAREAVLRRVESGESIAWAEVRKKVDYVKTLENGERVTVNRLHEMREKAQAVAAADAQGELEA